VNIWHSIPNHSRYQITVTGKVRHKRHKRVLRLGVPSNGYPQVSIHDDTERRIISKCVHHLMAATFLGPRPAGYIISFKDHNKRNCHRKNIYYRKDFNYKSHG